MRKMSLTEAKARISELVDKELKRSLKQYLVEFGAAEPETSAVLDLVEGRR